MIDNSIIQCVFCKTIIRLRFQMGYFDIPFDVCCPKCGVHINGWRRIVHENSLTVNNADAIVRALHDVDYYADLSVELPSCKISKYESEESIIKNGFSPFMNLNRYFDYETYQSVIKCVGRFLAFRENRWQHVRPLIDVLFSGNVTLAKDKFLELSACYTVENELDATMVLHQMAVLGISNLLPDDTLKDFTQYATRIYHENDIAKIISFTQALGGSAYLNSVSKRFVDIYSRWLIDYEKYNPVVMLVLGNAIEKLDKEQYGITTTSFEDMKSFYSDSYELLLDMIGVAVGLNNLSLRNDYNSFSAKVKTKDFVSFWKLAKAERIAALIEEEPYSKPISIHRHIRNAVAHYNYEFDPNSQRIHFFDYHKGKENTTTIYLVDLAHLCYDNMKILVYLNELLYNIKKIDFLRSGLVPHIKPLKKEQTNAPL